VSVLGLSRRESWWKDAEILMVRHQLAVALRERQRAHSRLTWPDRAWLALLTGTLPAERLAGLGARRLAADERLPWQQPCLPGRLTPARVRRGFRAIHGTRGWRCHGQEAGVVGGVPVHRVDAGLQGQPGDQLLQPGGGVPGQRHSGCVR
jgi:hypothetical protein